LLLRANYLLLRAKNSGRHLLLGLRPLPTKSAAGGGATFGATSGTVIALVDPSHSANGGNEAHHGGNEQMFGAESQDPHGQSEYEAAGHLAHDVVLTT
jgi:hypothetical protein